MRKLFFFVLFLQNFPPHNNYLETSKKLPSNCKVYFSFGRILLFFYPTTNILWKSVFNLINDHWYSLSFHNYFIPFIYTHLSFLSLFPSLYLFSIHTILIKGKDSPFIEFFITEEREPTQLFNWASTHNENMSHFKYH